MGARGDEPGTICWSWAWETESPDPPRWQVRYRVTGVQRQETAFVERTWRMGWRVYATNAPASRLSFADGVRHYRLGWCGELNFHVLKDRPLGIKPLFVHRDDQITGLTRLLSLGARVLRLIETRVRQGLATDDTALAGLYLGQPTRTTDRPTATRLLEAIARSEMTLTSITHADACQEYLTPLPPWLPQVLGYVGVSVACYTRLVENST